MLQNKYIFNQSSVELAIEGLPDYSNNDDKDNISIISSWKLSIINQPEIEGSIDHLKSVIKAFYECAILSLLDLEEKVESELIDLNHDEGGIYNLLLKSTKPNIKPLRLKIGYSEFSDIINCFDQLKNSTKIKINFEELSRDVNIKNSLKVNKLQLFENFIPPFIALVSISFFTLISIYFYDSKDNRNRNISSLDSNLLALVREI
tara:strand:+ start:475 stop:1089 length:615 start_codon:yes stop_codon:yes gene_type:complete